MLAFEIFVLSTWSFPLQFPIYLTQAPSTTIEAFFVETLTLSPLLTGL